MPHLLTLLVVVPVAGALVAILYSFAPGRREEHYKWIAFLTTLATFALSLLLIQGASGSTAAFSFEENVSWIGAIGARYHLGIDGISLWLRLRNARSPISSFC
jgi:NADH-quinone oxidoreductase subunit M